MVFKMPFCAGSCSWSQPLYYGAGAGAGPTASAVVADVIDIVRDISYTEDGAGTIPQLAFEALTNVPILSREQMTTGYYIRTQCRRPDGCIGRCHHHSQPCGDQY